MLLRLAESIKSEIRKGLPGQKAQLRMAPEVRLNINDELQPKDAGVLILLYPVNGSVYTVLIKRTDYPGVHSGQVSFPSGKYEPADKDICFTAIRETEEELGISLEQVEVLGRLTKLHIPVSNIMVYPLIAAIKYRPVFHPDRAEVDDILEVNLSELIRPGIIGYSTRQILGRETSVPYYNIQQRQVWGATAMIISEFLELIRQSRHFQPE